MLAPLAKFISKRFIIGKIYYWIKPKLHGFLTLALVVFLIFYIHNEYLSYIEFSEKISNDNRFIGPSFILKNVLVLIAIIVYLTFVFFIKKTKDGHDNENTVEKEKSDKEKTEKVENLDFLLDEDELK